MFQAGVLFFPVKNAKTCIWDETRCCMFLMALFDEQSIVREVVLPQEIIEHIMQYITKEAFVCDECCTAVQKGFHFNERLGHLYCSSKCYRLLPRLIVLDPEDWEHPVRERSKSI